MAIDAEAKEVNIKIGRRELEKLAVERDALDKRAEKIKRRTASPRKL